MNLSIADFRGVRRAEIELGPLTLVAGRNGAGKSSVCLAAGAALTLQAIPPIDGEKIAKKDAWLLVRTGATVAAVTLEHPGGSVCLSWPGATVSTVGDNLRCSAFSAGLSRFTALRPEERARYLQDAIGAKPDRDDLAKGLAEAEMAENTIDSANHFAAAGKMVGLDAMWRRIEVDGWDASHAAAQKRGAEYKGQWREVTGEAYGSAKAQAWRPAALRDEDLDVPMEDLLRRRDEAKGAAISAAVAADREARKEAAAKKAAVAERHIPDLKNTVATAKKAMDQALSQRAQAPAHEGDSGLPCPWCAKSVRVVRETGMGAGFYAIEKYEQALSKEEHDRRTKMLAALDKAVAQATESWREAAGTLAQAEADVKAYKALLDAPAKPAEAPEPDISERVAAVEKFRRAAEIAGKIAQNAIVVEALGPGGVRDFVMGEALKRLNDELVFFCSASREGVPPPQIAADMSVSRDGRPYALLSESERFRCDVAIHVALARECGDTAIVIDGADVLDAGGRQALVTGLLAAGVPALVGMTLSAERLMPDLSEVGGRSYWMEG